MSYWDLGTLSAKVKDAMSIAYKIRVFELWYRIGEKTSVLGLVLSFVLDGCLLWQERWVDESDGASDTTKKR